MSGKGVHYLQLSLFLQPDIHILTFIEIQQQILQIRQDFAHNRLRFKRNQHIVKGMELINGFYHNR